MAPRSRCRGHQHETGETVGLDLPALPLITRLGRDAQHVGTFAQEPARLIRDVARHQEVAEFVRDTEAATRFAPSLAEDGARLPLRVGHEAALELVGAEVLKLEDAEASAQLLDQHGHRKVPIHQAAMHPRPRDRTAGKLVRPVTQLRHREQRPC